MRLGINGRFYGAARVTGIQRCAREITSRLCRLEDCVVFLPGGVSRPPDLPDTVQVVTGRLPGHPWEQLELPRVVRRNGCDVTVHLAGTAPVRGGPYVMAVHDVTPLTNPEWFRRRFAWWYRIGLAAAGRRVAALLTDSEWSRSEVTRVLRRSADDVHVVSQGLAPFDRPADDDVVRSVRSRYGLDGPYLLTTGGGDPRKNIDFLVDLLRAWPADLGPPPTLVIVGESNPRVHPVRNGPRPDPADVRRVGFVTDGELHALYTGATVFCYPSLAEGFGRPPVEAMACGAPVIAAEYGTAREVLHDTAVILPLDPTRWFEEIAALMTNGAMRTLRVERGRRHVAPLSWDTCASQVLSICQNVVERSIS